MPLQSEPDFDVPFKDRRHEAIVSVVRTAHALTAAGAALFREFGLTEAQFNVLFVLKHRERELTQSDLGRRLVVTRASITSVLDKLESKKLVQRLNVEGNRRIYHVVLTKAGRALVDRVEPIYRDRLQAVTRDFSESECQQLTRSLGQVRAQAYTLSDASGR